MSDQAAQEVIEPDYPTAAAAWMCLEMTMAAMKYRATIQRIAYEYGQRLVAELGVLEEPPA